VAEAGVTAHRIWGGGEDLTKEITVDVSTLIFATLVHQLPGSKAHWDSRFGETDGTIKTKGNVKT